ncbi:helix-turn-helix domain-containing protein [Salmonella sp. SAL4455]
MRDEGLSLRTIAAIFGVSDKTVRNWTEAVSTNGRAV